MPSSSGGKTTGDAKPHDTGGHWYMPTGSDTRMQIDTTKKQQHDKGRCFWCDKKGHLSKDCPDKGQKREVWAVDTDVPLAESTKVEEVKE